MRAVLGARETALLRELVMSAESSEPSSAGTPELDWRVFLLAARRHRIGALVLQGGDEAGYELPRAVHEPLRRDRDRELAKTVVRLHQLDAIATAASSSGRRIIFLKGVFTSLALYAHPSLRPMADIDLLVEASDFGWWCASLSSFGYEERDASDHATLFENRRRGVYVELHRTLTSCADYLRLEPGAFFERSVSAPGYADPAVRTLSLEDHLLHLSLHSAFQHGMRQPAINAWDAHLLARHEAFDIGVFLSRVQSTRIRSFVYGGLCLADTLFPHPALSEARQSLASELPPRLARRAARMRPELLLSPSKDAVFGSPMSRFTWVERPVDALSLAREIARPRRGGGLSAYVARASQLLRNHVVTPVLVANNLPLAPLSSSTKASLEEVRDV